MNYIMQIRHFWKLHEEHAFTLSDIALYFHLLEICNTCCWKNPFKRNNTRICADLGMSHSTLQRSRRRLQKHGLLRFESHGGVTETIYTLTEVFRGDNELVDKSANDL